MSIGDVLALIPALSPIVVLVIFLWQQSRKDDNTLSVAWVGVAPELFKGFREDLKQAREDAESANRRALEAWEAAHAAQEENLRLAEDFNRYKFATELYTLELKGLLQQHGITVPDRKHFNDPEGMTNG